jgi:hypothetical protein
MNWQKFVVGLSMCKSKARDTAEQGCGLLKFIEYDG